MEQLVATAALVAGLGPVAWSYIVCGLLGAAVGFVELISRYRDSPMAAVRCPSAMVYILVNSGAAILALYLLRIYGSDLFASDSEQKRWLTEVLVSGLGSMTLMRSSIFNVSIGAEEKMPVGPAVLLDVILKTADRGVDRRRAKDRALFISGLMKDVSYEKADMILPRYCFALMQNAGEKEKQAINENLKRLRDTLELSKDRDTSQSGSHRSHILGLSLLQLVGPHVLAGAVKGLKQHIKVTEVTVSSSAGQDGEGDSDAKKKIARMRQAAGKGNGARNPRADRSGTLPPETPEQKRTSDDAQVVANQPMEDTGKSSNGGATSVTDKPS